MKLHQLITITGPSGSGKTTLANHFFNPDQTLVSFTTRPKRPGEIDGIDYYFIHDNQLKELEDEHKVIEEDQYDNHFYGYTKDEIIDKLKDNNCVAVVTQKGYKTLKNLPFLKGHIIPVYVHTDYADIKKHMQNRNDNIDNINKRLKLFNTKNELVQEEEFKQDNAIIHNNIGLSIKESQDLFKRELLKYNINL